MASVVEVLGIAHGVVLKIKNLKSKENDIMGECGMMVGGHGMW